MRTLADDDEQVAFWLRHTKLGVGLCVVLPVVLIGYTLLSSDAPHRGLSVALAAAVCLLSPLLLLVPVRRLVRSPRGGWFFYGWEAGGIALVLMFAALDRGAGSPIVTIFYVLLAHAALAYPPAGLAVAGGGTILAFLGLGLLGPDTSAEVLVVTSATLAVATATCAVASFNHVRAYQRTSAYAQRIALLAERDGLTGCLNHRTFHQRLGAEAAVTDQEHPLALLLVDVDHFKTVNDSHGHPAGDQVLALVGEALRSCSGPGDAVGRLGGDEFAALLPGRTSSAALAVAERVRRQVREAPAALDVTVSVGFAVTRTRADAQGLLVAADRAVYRAKRAGRDQVAGPSDTSGIPAPRTAGRV
ncbi:MAG TPA: GGDEF domain-containing protein [Actinomycetales bacterium]|nr:GGDEF domain-containing protein [Actinomycetales bacterium]